MPHISNARILLFTEKGENTLLHATGFLYPLPKTIQGQLNALVPQPISFKYLSKSISKAQFKGGGADIERIWKSVC